MVCIPLKIQAIEGEARERGSGKKAKIWTINETRRGKHGEGVKKNWPTNVGVQIARSPHCILFDYDSKEGWWGQIYP